MQTSDILSKLRSSPMKSLLIDDFILQIKQNPIKFTAYDFYELNTQTVTQVSKWLWSPAVRVTKNVKNHSTKKLLLKGICIKKRFSFSHFLPFTSYTFYSLLFLGFRYCFRFDVVSFTNILPYKNCLKPEVRRTSSHTPCLLMRTKSVQMIGICWMYWWPMSSFVLDVMSITLSI